MNSRQNRQSSAALLLVIVFPSLVLGQPLGEQLRHGEQGVLVAPLLHAKRMPDGFRVKAMAFTAPAGDGRRGSAGFVVQSREVLQGDGGTGWQFTFRRDPSGFGFQMIHPFQQGHVLIAIGSAVTIHRGGSWSKIGWGDPKSSDRVQLMPAAKQVIPLKTDVRHSVVSQLSKAGEYRLWIDGALICRHRIEQAKALILETKAKKRIWGGSSWNDVSFAGAGFRPLLKPGEAGLILGPMDGSGPRQCFEQITLTGLSGSSVPQVDVDDDFDPLFARIADLRKAGRLTMVRAVGGSGGGAFEEISEGPSVLVGFIYTTSRFYGGHLTIKAVRPVFRNREGEWIGEWRGHPAGKARRVQARDGYVVAGVVAKGGHRVDGMRLIFMRVQQGRLNPDDTYRSDWIGGRGGHPETLYAANGQPLVGIYGRTGADLDALGFLQADPTPAPQAARSLQALMPRLKGKWLVTYMNKTKHTREIHANQRVNENDEIVERNGDILICFPDVIERVTLVGDRLFVEHFNPSSTYPAGSPAAMGIGRKVKP